MTYTILSSPEAYREHYEVKYAEVDFELRGWKVIFYKEQFDHAFYDIGSSKKRDKFAVRRARRIDEISDVLDGDVTYILHSEQRMEYRYKNKVILYVPRSNLAIVLKKTKKSLIFTTIFTVSPKGYNANLAKEYWKVDEGCL